MPEKPSQTIFVVDDDLLIASTLALILNSSGFSATGLTNGQQAIEAAELGCPDLLITDVSMPGMNGVELATRFKALCPSCKVLLFSGHISTGELLEDAKQQGCDFQILVKHIHPKDLLGAINKM
jgi:CheY-like chemotaxis protein